MGQSVNSLVCAMTPLTCISTGSGGKEGCFHWSMASIAPGVSQWQPRVIPEAHFPEPTFLAGGPADLQQSRWFSGGSSGPVVHTSPPL